MSEVSTEPAGELVETVARVTMAVLWKREQFNGVTADWDQWRKQMGSTVDAYERLAAEITRAAIAAMPAAGEVDQLNGALSAYKAICEHRNQQNETLRAQLAASQADVARLREVLGMIEAIGDGSKTANSLTNIADIARAAIKDTRS